MITTGELVDTLEFLLEEAIQRVSPSRSDRSIIDTFVIDTEGLGEQKSFDVESEYELEEDGMKDGVFRISWGDYALITNYSNNVRCSETSYCNDGEEILRLGCSYHVPPEGWRTMPIPEHSEIDESNIE